MPGDDLFSPADEAGTRAIGISSDPATVFGFLTQMGFGRAGWYSYDWLDNLGRRSATTLRPEWAVTQAGEEVPAGPLSFTVAALEAPTAFVLVLTSRPAVDFTLAYRLDPEGDEGTRLVSRVRLSIRGPVKLAPASRTAARALLLGDGAMVRRQLLGIKSRCEHLNHPTR